MSLSPQYQQNDPFNIINVEDLLHQANDWKNTQDITRLTIKALTDVVKSQGSAIRDLEKQIIKKAIKSDVNIELATKANAMEMQQQFTSFQKNLENKVSFDDLNKINKEFAQKSDLQYLEQIKCSQDEVQALLAKKVGQVDFQKEITQIQQKFDTFQKDLKHIQQINQNDIFKIQNNLLEKANLTQINEVLEQKANKQTVTNALQQKVNKIDFDAIISRKCDISEINNIISNLELKAETTELQLVEAELNEKFNNLQYQVNQKTEIKDFQKLEINLKENIIDSDQQYNEVLQKLEEVRQDQLTFQSQVQTTFQKTAKLDDLEKVNILLGNKVEQVEINKIIQNQKQNLLNIQSQIKQDFVHLKEDNLQFNKQINQRIDNLNTENLDFQKVLDQRIEEVYQKIEYNGLEQQNIIQNQKEDQEISLNTIKQQILENKNSLMKEIIKKVDTQILTEFKQQINQNLEIKVDLNEVQTALNAVQADISQRFMEFKDDVRMVIKDNIDQQNEEVQNQLDNFQNNTDILQKVDYGDFNNLKDFVERLFRDVQEKADFTQTQQFLDGYKNKIDDIVSQLLLKANTKDICMLLDTKTNIEDINKIFGQFQKDLNERVTNNEMKSIVADQALLNEQVCTENIVGRWAWKSGDILQGNQVPWEIQIVNTLPDNFLWEKNNNNIIIVTPGLYQISCGFFAKKKPQIQIQVNGEPILSAVNTSSYVIHHTSGKLKDINNNQKNQITGLTLIDYLLIPQRARLSIAYSGDNGCEGFIGFKRL